MRARYALKRAHEMGRALWMLQRFASHQWWSRQQLEAFQQRQLSSLLQRALRSSPFYANLYQSYGADADAPLEHLPVVNKSMLVDNFDQIVTDPRLRLEGLQDHLATVAGDDYYLGEYRIVTTAGSSGEKAVFPYSRREWSAAQAASMRIGTMMGIRPRLPNRLRIAVIGSDSPLHLSYRLALTLETGMTNIQRAEATKSVEELVEWLNDFQPEVVEAYPFILGFLASEQLEGTLNVQPRTAVSAGEALAGEIVEKVRQAWGITPFDVYGTTEGLFAVDCSSHQGIHVFEDFSIVEVVDQDCQPVPDGSSGAKLLLTNLVGYTLPVIRYEVNDMLTVTNERCACGRTFRRITAVDGRADDVMYLQGTHGREVAVVPAHFWAFMEGMEEVKQYQVVHQEDGLELHLVLRQGASQADVAERAKERFARILQDLGVKPQPVRVLFREGIQQNGHNSGKMKLVMSNAGNSRAA